MATYRDMFTDWTFDSTAASSTVSSNRAKITLDQKACLLTLVPQSINVGRDKARIEFPKDTDLTITTKVNTVPNNKSWTKFQIDSDTPKSLDRVERTEVRLRITDGTSQYYWNGSAWTATTTLWSTPAQVNANLSSWSSTSLGFVVNLKTADVTLTPTVSRIRVLHSVDLPSYMNDIVYDTVIAAFQDNIRSVAFLAVESAGSTSVDLNDYDLESDYEIKSIDGVFNDTSDPTHKTDLLASYNAATKVITLSSPVLAGDTIWINFKYAPQVSYRASQDYTEIATLPSIVFDSIVVEDLGEAPTSDYIMDTFLTPPQSVILPAPRRSNVVFTLDAYAPLMSDLYLLQETVMSFLQTKRTIDSAASGKPMTLRITSDFAPFGGNQTKDIEQSRMTFQLENVYMWLRPAEAADASTGTGFGVSGVKMTSQVGHTSNTLTITED